MNRRRLQKLIIIALLGVAICFVSPALMAFEVETEIEKDQADKSEESDSKIVVTGTKTKKFMKTAPVKTDLIDRQRMESKGAGTLFDALNAETGLLADNQCQNCAANTVSINGLEGNYTQMLFNGYPTLSSLAGVYFLQQFPVELVDRVEVVRGGASALYGSGAIGGVVNVITRKPVSNQASLTYKQEFVKGDEAFAHTVSGFASAVSRNAKAGLAVFGSKMERDDWDANGDGYSDLARTESKTFGASGYLNIMKGMELSYNFYSLYEDRKGGNNLDKEPFDSNIREQAKTNRDSGDFRLEHEVSDLFSYAIFGAFARSKRHTYYGPAGDPADPLNLPDNVTLYGNTENPYFATGANANITPRKNHTISLGYEYTSDKIDDENPGMGREVEEHYQNHGAYAQYDWGLKVVNLLAGVRADKHSEMNEIVAAPRLSAILRFSDHLRLRGGVSAGYKAPQVFDEDFHIEVALASGSGHQQVIINSEDIEAEKSMSYSCDLSADAHFGGFLVDLGVGGFYTTIKDKMEVDYTAPSLVVDNIDYFLRDNVDGTSKVIGGNLEASLSYKNLLRFSFGGTWIAKAVVPEEQVFDNDTTKDMLRVPEMTAFTMLQAFLGDLTATFSTQYIGSQKLEHDVGTPLNRLEKTDTFLVLNAQLRYRWKIDEYRHADLFAGVDNISDSYQDDLDEGDTRDAGYIYGPVKPRTYYLGMRVGI
ncbi:MAG TPA: TonB-dependent receptor [Spirochaetota bacterium]|nr:TonB-dependent receptor [Spirochaetota bacterium]